MMGAIKESAVLNSDRRDPLPDQIQQQPFEN